MYPANCCHRGLRILKGSLVCVKVRPAADVPYQFFHASNKYCHQLAFVRAELLNDVLVVPTGTGFVTLHIR